MKSLGRGVLIIVGVMVVALFVIGQWDAFRLEAELQEIAHRKAVEAESLLEETPARVATAVVASRDAILLGQARGKISVYVERGESASIEGYEYFFERERNGQWRQTESGRCTSEQCSIEGRKLMQALDEAP